MVTDLRDDELKAVEAVRMGEKGSDAYLYQIWDEGDRYSVNVVGRIENPAEYGADFECEGSIDLKPGTDDEHYAWSPVDKDDHDVYIFGYDRHDIRDGDQPSVAADITSIGSRELEYMLESAFNDEPVSRD